MGGPQISVLGPLEVRPAGRLPAAKLVILDGADHPPYFGEAEALLREIEGFLLRS